jgi:membrane protein required for colicin V production
MNFMDVVYLLLVLASLALGFFNGTVKLVVAIVAFYVSITLSSLYFQSLGLFYRNRFGSTLEVAQVTAFTTILLVAFLLLTIAGLYTFRYAKLPASLDFVDRIVGTLLGLVMGALFLGVLSGLLKDLFVFQTPGIVAFPVGRAFVESVGSSFLVEYFSSDILPMIYNSVRPVLPREADIIFRV